ncbi:MAG: UDP-N-acetylmuramoyl-L-alanyl-D-glutamate--2,6-diaminopimelate ligase [Simplicispira suum]|uniref:UDP-N-acetylmuramoyl-L-alanyl-D-glutamate--2, 6-diaminopimelate ligase n=1 Tax=Simplicispira suum TaxID=2109915 RepID=UPI001C6C5E97|nr:UDP-N-acetylmuramoyl-L-alanyl-D-glutamate--2,6-diaminopimelate ligase [Simplicispira suum]MBW7831994.1 UDP-N-acetylmuramoyl-L-alanyl-D-glutamate--2,6-diaminopimelate ligase [Simplicispira suum]
MLHTSTEALAWLRERATGTLQIDSRRIAPGDAFIAWPGAAIDARAHLADARTRGASACLVEAVGAEAFDVAGADVALLANLKAATGELAAAWFGAPSEALQVVAFTGTNGKTSSACWLAQALSNCELYALAPCALVGTLGMGFPDALQETGLTTPDPVRLQRGLRALVDAGAKSCAIEASSIGLAEHRLAGMRIAVAVFTNFTQDHLDYHGSMEAYLAAKRALFAWPGLRAAVLNIDDAAGAEMQAQVERAGLDVWTVSQTGRARLRAQHIELGPLGLQCVVSEGEQQLPLQTTLIGQYNISNLLGVIGAMRALGVPLDAAVRACERLGPVPGRMERLLSPGQPLVAVDYAHTPDALEKALQALRPLAAQRGGQLWCVFGCGGDRDAGKRPLMGAAAQHHADRVVVTSDNPRSEDPAAILHQILLGTIAGATVRAEPDRAAAIAQVLAQAAPADVVLIAGKGHEAWQEIAGVKRPFSDLEHARAALQLREVAA